MSDFRLRPGTAADAASVLALNNANVPHVNALDAGTLTEILALHSAEPLSEHLEVETYTWDVLPERDRAVPLAGAIARELQWVLQRLAART